MNTILLKIHNTKQTVAEAVVVTKDGAPTTVKALKRVNYELIDQATNFAPHHIVTKRVAQDLHVSFEEDGQVTDLVIEEFYDAGDTALIGLAEDGQYYYFIPDTANASDYVTELAVGDIEGQALGGTPYAAPWWVGATEKAGFPWIGLLAGIGGIIALDDDDDNNGKGNGGNDIPPPDVLTRLSDEIVSVTPKPNANNEIPTSMHIRVTTNTGAEANLFASRTDNNWSISSQDFDIATNNVKIDEQTGVVSIPISALQASSSVIATQVIAGMTSAQDNDAVPASQTPPDVATPDVTVPTDGSAVITPDSDPHPDCTVITYKDESGAEQRIVVVRDKAAGTWSLKADETTVTVAETATTDNKTPFFDTTTGVVTIPALAVQDKSNVLAVHKVLDSSGNKVDAGRDDENVGDNPNPNNITQTTLKPVVVTQLADGVVSFSLIKNTTATKAVVKDLIAPDGSKKDIVLTKDIDGNWQSEDPSVSNWKVETNVEISTQDTKTNQMVHKVPAVRFFIPANQVKDQTLVLVEVTDNAVANNVLTYSSTDNSGKGGDETADTTPPALILAGSATGETVELTYNEQLDSTTVPAIERFTVSVDGQAITINGVQITDSKVTIALKDPVVLGKTIKVTYDDPTSNNDPVTTSSNPQNPVQDVAGNDVPDSTIELTAGMYTAQSDMIDFGLIGDVNMIDLGAVNKASLHNVTHANVTASNNGLFIKGDVGDTITLGTVLDTGSASIQVDGAGQWKKDDTPRQGSTVAGDDSTYDIWRYTDGIMLYIDADMTVL